jgi:hypothetical protein
MLDHTGERGARWFRYALIASAVVVSAIAWRWIPAPWTLAPQIDAGLAARDTLAPIALREVMPSFYFWDFSSYWTYPPNVVAMAAVALLAIAGARVCGKNP